MNVSLLSRSRFSVGIGRSQYATPHLIYTEGFYWETWYFASRRVVYDTANSSLFMTRIT